jgi:hypothetical protein
MENKFTLDSLFKTRDVIEGADFIAVKMEKENKYYIYKSRYSDSDGYFSEDAFKEILLISRMPIVLSDSYIDLDSSCRYKE